MSDEKTFGETIAERGTIIPNPFGHVPFKATPIEVEVTFAPGMFMHEPLSTISSEDGVTGTVSLSGMTIIVEIEKDGKRSQAAIPLSPLITSASSVMLTAMAKGA